MKSKIGTLKLAMWGLLGLLIIAVDYVAVTGGDDLLELIIKKRTDIDDIEARLAKHEPTVRFVDMVYSSRPYPTQMRIDESRPADVKAMMSIMYERYNDGDYRGADEAANAVLGRDPDNVDTIILKVMINAWSGSLDSLSGMYRSKAEGARSSAAWQLGLGRLLLEKGKTDEGLAHIEEAGKLNPALPGLHLQKGYYLANFASRRDIAGAMKEYQREIDSTKHPAAYTGLESLLGKVRDDEAAVRVFEEYKKHYPMIWRNCLDYAWKLSMTGDKEGTKKAVIDCLPVAEKDVGIRNDLGYALLNARLWGEAKEHFSSMVNEFEKTGSQGLRYRIHLGLGRALLHMGNIEAAISELERSIEIYETSIAFYFSGIAQLIKGDNSGADKDFEKCTRVQKDEDFPWCRDYEKGKSFSNARYFHHLIKEAKGKRFSAEEVFHVSTWFRDPTPADREAEAGEGCLYWGAFDLGKSHFDNAIRIDPVNGRAWAGLVDLHRYRGELKKSIETGEDAIARGVQHTYLYNNLGYSYYRGHDYKQAETMYRYSLQMLPQNTQANINMARLLERTGRTEEAQYYWNLTNAAPELVADPLGEFRLPAVLLANALIAFLIWQRSRRKSDQNNRTPSVRSV